MSILNLRYHIETLFYSLLFWSLFELEKKNWNFLERRSIFITCDVEYYKVNVECDWNI